MRDASSPDGAGFFDRTSWTRASSSVRDAARKALVLFLGLAGLRFLLWAVFFAALEWTEMLQAALLAVGLGVVDWGCPPPSTAAGDNFAGPVAGNGHGPSARGRGCGPGRHHERWGAGRPSGISERLAALAGPVSPSGVCGWPSPLRKATDGPSSPADGPRAPSVRPRRWPTPPQSRYVTTPVTDSVVGIGKTSWPFPSNSSSICPSPA